MTKSEWISEINDILHELQNSEDMNREERSFIAKRARNVANSDLTPDEYPEAEDFIIETLGRLKHGSHPGARLGESRTGAASTLRSIASQFVGIDTSGLTTAERNIFDILRSAGYLRRSDTDVVEWGKGH
jgi:hypothetical protein